MHRRTGDAASRRTSSATTTASPASRELDEFEDRDGKGIVLHRFGVFRGHGAGFLSGTRVTDEQMKEYGLWSRPPSR